jgi:hypothetical protein
VGRHANGDTPTGILFVAPADPSFRRAAGGKKASSKEPKAGKSTKKSTVPLAAETAFLPAQRPPEQPAAATQLIPAQRGPAPSGAARVPAPLAGPVASRPVPARPVPARPAPAAMVTARPTPVATAAAAGVSRLRAPLSLPMWTKVCVVLGAMLVLVGFGGLGAAYAVNQGADSHSAGSELIRR